MTRPALFLDRDGVINVDHGYVVDSAQFEWRDGIFDLAKAAHCAGMPVVVVTNQSGIGRGYYTEEQFAALTDWMCARFVSEGAPITAVYHCPYHPEATVPQYRRTHSWRKPAPGMILAARDDLDLDLASSTLVGDQWSDIAAARAAGVGRAILVSGSQRETRPVDLFADATLVDINDVACWFSAAPLPVHSK
jgi:D-glycero-D-manno-heptose 1,7-bisphosphate phosphatase